MTHWRALIERDHLGAWDLQGSSWTLTIATVERKKVFTKKANAERGKAVITFRGGKKPWIVNATNCEAIESLYGSDFESWVGKPITIFPTTTSVGKKSNIPCIRVKPKVIGKDEGKSPDAPVDQKMREAQNDAFERQPGED